METQVDTNNFGILSWEFEAPSISVDFPDITLTIEDHRITTKTFQKRLNLYLYQYVMRSSNHSPRIMKGIIYSHPQKLNLRSRLPPALST